MNSKEIFKTLTEEESVGGKTILKPEDILSDEDKKKPEVACGPSSSDKPKKACANCTCGLAEQQTKSEATIVKSSCGSCYLGDAFRCASCPYKGMPAFKPGEKVTIDAIDDL